MKNSRFVLARLALVTLLVMTSVLVLAPGASANVKVPGGDVPFYARIYHTEIYHTGDWAAIAFYRPVACVPAGFNLLDFYDIPGAFGCQEAITTTTAGFEIWTTGPGLDPAPKLSQLQGLGAVPVWFVSWPELQAAVSDHVLTIGELSGLASLVEGSASFFHEVLRPSPESHVATIEINASGSLEDGRSFQWHSQGTGDSVNACSARCITHIVIR